MSCLKMCRIENVYKEFFRNELVLKIATMQLIMTRDHSSTFCKGPLESNHSSSNFSWNPIILVTIFQVVSQIQFFESNA